MFNLEILDTCTIGQACEWIAFGWEPMPPQYEAYCNHIRPIDPNYPTAFMAPLLPPPPTPSYTWEEYNKEMHRACAKLTIALLQKEVIAQGVNKAYKRVSDQKHDIHFGENDILDWRSNQKRWVLIDTIQENETCITVDISIDFNLLKKVFPRDAEETSSTIFKLVFDESNDCVYLYTGDIQKTSVKKFIKTDNKSKQVIKYIMSHPNKLVTRDEIKQFNIKGFDNNDRIDVIIKNAFSNLNIYKLFFNNLTSSSAKFVEQITNRDIFSAGIQTICLK